MHPLLCFFAPSRTHNNTRWRFLQATARRLVAMSEAERDNGALAGCVMWGEIVPWERHAPQLHALWASDFMIRRSVLSPSSALMRLCLACFPPAALSAPAQISTARRQEKFLLWQYSLSEITSAINCLSQLYRAANNIFISLKFTTRS